MDTLGMVWLYGSIALNIVLFIAVVWLRQRNDDQLDVMREMKRDADVLVASRQVRRQMTRAKAGQPVRRK